MKIGYIIYCIYIIISLGVDTGNMTRYSKNCPITKTAVKIPMQKNQ